MARPSIVGLFDSRIRVWRPVVSRDNLGVESRSHVLVATVGAAVNRSSTAERPDSGGEAPDGTLRWYGKANIDIQPRDVCEVISGPDQGRTWEVDAEPVRPRNHHTQVDCVEWHGTLPSTEPVS